jgi:plastocyanin
MRLTLGALPLLAGLALVASACGGGASAEDRTIAIRYSRFIPEVVTVEAGQQVTFELRNDDPIEHEWIVGTAAVHERHRTGTEPYHDQVPTEVTVPALSTRFTTVTFDEPGEYLYICHLPGHEQYGMVGTVVVE